MKAAAEVAMQLGKGIKALPKDFHKRIQKVYRRAQRKHRLVPRAEGLMLRPDDKNRALKAFKQAIKGESYNMNDLKILAMNKEEYETYKVNNDKPKERKGGNLAPKKASTVP